MSLLASSIGGMSVHATFCSGTALVAEAKGGPGKIDVPSRGKAVQNAS
jgi:hypothetical protein